MAGPMIWPGAIGEGETCARLIATRSSGTLVLSGVIRGGLPLTAGR
jgi:hypothetical protein